MHATRLAALTATLLFVTLAYNAHAATQKLVVVMPMDKHLGTLDAAGAAIVEEAVRSATGNALSPHGFTVATQDTALQLLRDNGVDAEKSLEADSALAANRLLKSGLFVTITVASSDGKHSGQVRLVETATGRLIASVELGGQSADGLKQSFKRKQEKFFASAVEALGVSASPAQTKVAKTEQSPAPVVAKAAPVSESDDEDEETEDPTHRKHTAQGESRKESQRLRRLCNKGDGPACVARGRIYETGEGMKRRDFGTALDQYLQGCKLGASAGCDAARALVHSNDTAHRYATEGCERGNKLECAALK